MIKKEDIKVGLLIWWIADRRFKQWSCPAVVTAVGNTQFRLQSLDDFAETDLSIDSSHGEFICEIEMCSCTIEEARGYLEAQRRKKRDTISIKAGELKDAKAQMVEFLKNVQKFAETYP